MVLFPRKRAQLSKGLTDEKHSCEKCPVRALGFYTGAKQSESRAHSPLPIPRTLAQAIYYRFFSMRSVLISFHWQPNDQDPRQSNHVFPEPSFPRARATPGQRDEQLQEREWVLIERNVNYIYLFATYKALNP